VLERTIRVEGRAVLATLIRQTGRFDVAEEAVQDAVARALEVWRTAGVPAHPRAWLITAARNRAIDIIRRDTARPRKEGAAHAMASSPFDESGGSSGATDGPDGMLSDDSSLPDDVLRLVFTCCHPSLSAEAQVALSLRTLCGLSTPEVARALLVSEATMTKRLTRARQKITKAHIPYCVPADHELPERLSAVVTTVYLMFNEGYAATTGDAHVRVDLADEAVRLARLLHALLPDEAQVIGLLALVLLVDARRTTRVDHAGDLVLLADQDRSRWDPDAIREGVVLVGEGLRRTPDRPDRFVVQAAIAAAHCLAASVAETDWTAIVSWYDVLSRVDASPVVRLNRAVAIGERDGAAAGLLEVDAIGGMTAYPLWHGSRAEFLARLDCRAEAVQAFDEALSRPLTEAQRRHLTVRRQSVNG